VTKTPAKTVFVAGARRGAGKTMVSAFLLRSLPGAGAVKITCCRAGERCPREKSCGVCRALSNPFAVIQDHHVLATPGKDTARLLEAATGKVAWLQSRPESLAEGLRAALSALGEASAVVVEGNAAFEAFAPDLGVLVIGSGPQPAKPSANVALPFVSGVVLNTEPSEAAGAVLPGLSEDVRTFRFDVTQPEGDPEAAAFIEWVATELGFHADSGHRT